MLPDPIEQFIRWFSEAEQAGIPQPNAMTLATAAKDGAPSARMVLLKGVDSRGFVFYTNFDSRKGRELNENPRAALLFWWEPLQRQVRVEGRVQRLDEAESDAYFASRPRGHQLQAHASLQSRVIPHRDELEERFRAAEEEFEGRQVARPRWWGGFRVVPESVEFWQEGPNRLHDRLRYRREAGGGWRLERLAP